MNGNAQLSYNVAGEVRHIAARQRLLSFPGEPLLYADWVAPLFIHYEIDPEVLQPYVPFPLDVYEGKAFVSVVAFTMRNLRPRVGGRLAAWLFSPITTHELLNVRTYVRSGDEPGIYFLAEWVPNRLSAWLGPRTFGLPYRFGRLHYEHSLQTGVLRGTVADRRGRFRYAAGVEQGVEYRPCAPGSLDEFLLERYTAYTLRGRRRKLFRIWHAPWMQTDIAVQIQDESLLSSSFPWFRDARCTGFNFSPGAARVWMGRPHGAGFTEKRMGRRYGFPSAQSNIPTK